MPGFGFDYSMGAPHPETGGPCNQDPKTGIRYGIISVHRLSEWFWDSVETIYQARCPECGNDLDTDAIDASDGPLACPGACGCEYGPDDTDDLYGDEPDGHVLDGQDGIQGHVDGDNDVWITSSLYYTRGTFCSPCAPGAVTISSPHKDGPRAYCLPPDWFEDDNPPYPIFAVSDGSQVHAGPSKEPARVD